MRTITVPIHLTLMTAVLVAAATASADTYTVNSTVDAIDAAPGNGVCATTAGACTLRAAVQEANAHAGADVITLPAGVFALSVLGPGEDASASGDLDVTDAVEIDGAGRDGTIIDGINADRVVQSSAAMLALRDLTIRNGIIAMDLGGGLFQPALGNVTLERVRFESNQALGGGAIYQGANGTLTVTDSEFDANHASDGGAIFLVGGGALTLVGTTLASNRAFGGVGAGIFTWGTAPVSLSGCTISSNTAKGGGGGVVAGGSTTFALDGSTFSGNRVVGAGGAGGAFAYSGSGNVTITNTKALENLASVNGGGSLLASGTVVVSGSEFSDNAALTGDGGGLSVIAQGNVTIADTVLRRNAAGAGAGGGLYASTAGTLTLTDVEASENSGTGGGGLFLTGAIGSSATLTRVQALRNGSGTSAGGGIVASIPLLTIVESTIDGNVAAAPGGGVYAAATFAIADSTISNNRAAGAVGGRGGGLYLGTGSGSTLTNVTVSGNVAESEGGGMLSGGDLAVRNATFADNTASTGSALFNAAGTLTLASSIVSGSAPSHCAGAPVTSGDFNVDSDGSCGLTGPNDRTIDPQLGPLADNGGPTLTHLPAASSPAIDGGNPTGCPATDQRGQMRPTDGNGDGSAVCDVGAVEFVDLCPTDPAKVLPGVCGCGVPDTDAALPNGVADCLINGELKARIARAVAIVTALTGDPSEAALETELTGIAGGLGAYAKLFKAQLVVADPKAKLDKLAMKAKKTVKKVTKAKAGRKLEKARTRALAALGKLDQAVAAQP